MSDVLVNKIAFKFQNNIEEIEEDIFGTSEATRPSNGVLKEISE